jgi:hypothetical protein
MRSILQITGFRPRRRAAFSTDRAASSRRKVVRKVGLLILALCVTSSVATAQGRPTRFWNLTLHSIKEFYLAPAGTTTWGINQCKNDKDGVVDSDERLRITDTSAGTYDARLVDVTGRACLVRNIKVEAGEILSIEEKDLTSCEVKP